MSAAQIVREPMLRVALRAKLLRPLHRRRFGSFGPNSILHKPDWIYGPSKIEVGAGVIILHSIWLSAERSCWDRPGPAITIGDRVGIRPYCTISASESIEIADDVVLSAFTTVIDSDHTFDAGEPNVLWNPSRSAPVRIGRGTWVGERVAILRGSQIGRYCVVGANSVVRGEVPDYSVVAGVPARVVGTTAGTAPAA